jgi:hypothetical protein
LERYPAKLANGKPVEYYAQHIKNLSLLCPIQNEGIDDIMAICTGIENLALWGRFDFFGKPHCGRNLRRLTINLSKCCRSPNFHHPCFVNLTHLHLYDDHDDDDYAAYPFWETLSSLTHLAFACASPEIIMPLMQRLPAVQYVALGSHRGYEGNKFAVATVNNRPHIRAAWRVRVVFLGEIPEYDWERGARGEGDFWDIVEEEVERRLSVEDGSTA